MAIAQKTKHVVRLDDQQWLKLRNQLVQIVKVDDGQFTYRFRCETPFEMWRARTLLEKEEGTVRWIRNSVRDGEVFYDIGANIGLYTLLAGYRVGAVGGVYAFEPHVANVQSLLAQRRPEPTDRPRQGLVMCLARAGRLLRLQLLRGRRRAPR